MVNLIFVLLWVMIALTTLAIAMVLKGNNHHHSATRSKKATHQQESSATLQV
ncbi:MAG: hypothetical protein AAF632_21875 [Bacteroidota bacterium]